MDSPLFLLAPFLFWIFVIFLEYRNPLWQQFVRAAQPLPKTIDEAKSEQMVFFWRSAKTYGKSDTSDYWNAMDLIATSEGLIVKRPLFLFGRRSAFFPWGVLSPGNTFHAWLTKRRTLQLINTELYFSVTERFYRNHVQHHVASAN